MSFQPASVARTGDIFRFSTEIPPSLGAVQPPVRAENRKVRHFRSTQKTPAQNFVRAKGRHSIKGPPGGSLNWAGIWKTDDQGFFRPLVTLNALIHKPLKTGFVRSLHNSRCFSPRCARSRRNSLLETRMNDILTPAQLAERLQVGVSWIYEQTRNRASVRNADPLPHIQMGRYLRFHWPDICAWLERRKQ
jgi:hypothetical protein